MAKIQVMVVEDENVIALDIQNRLRRLGYAVSTVAVSGESAIDKAAQAQPDIVLMDIRLTGEMDGIEAAEYIHAQWDIPIIYLTAYADKATLQRAKITEPYGYLLKPFEERELQTAIEMALHRHKIERKVKESEAWLATTLKSIGDAVIATDEHGHIKFMNPVAEALTGWQETAALGKDAREIFNVINSETGRLCPNPIKQAIQKGTPIYSEDNRVLIAKDGREIPIDDNAAPIKDATGKINGAVLVFRDISERKKAEEQLYQYALELQQQNKELDAFAHTVAHDLRDPLSPIIGLAKMLARDLETVPTETLKGLLDSIAGSAYKMDSIIQELMILSGVRRDKGEREPLDMSYIVAEVQQRLIYIIEEHQAELIVPADWPIALGYSPWVEEVWANYISNAIKYGGRPPRVELGAKQQADGMVCFWVDDNGPGLKSEDQDRVFKPFTQLSQIRASGHGLGLSIVQRIVQKLGGQVKVVSKVGNGSRFIFTLPGVTGKINAPT